MKENYLELRNVSKVFGHGRGALRAVDNVNLQVKEGELVTLLGPSGCGKTTTLRMIAGFEDPTEGEILIDGVKMNMVPPNKRPTSLVFQNYALFPHMSVVENISYGLKINKLPADEIRRRVSHIIGLVGLAGMENRAPSQLSGGQQQRVSLARSLVMEPKVLLMDEPLSNLDAKLRVSMRVEIRKIQQRVGITSVYVTHDQEEAMILSDRIVVMNNGIVQQIGSPEEIYAHPVNLFVADFIGKANFLHGKLVKITGENSVQVAIEDKLFDLSIPEKYFQKEYFKENKPVTILLRPESTVILPRGKGMIPGIVKEILYLGSKIIYEVDVKGEKITVELSGPTEGARYKQEEPVDIGFERENIHIIPEG